jgi:glycosyltransferase involved in cell wall biosynthesis
MARPRCLGICLYYNDEDIVADSVEHLLANEHDLLVVDHGSTDGTPAILDRYRSQIRERFAVGRDVHLRDLFRGVSEHVLANHRAHYDWISFPASDEILEGPDRSRSYYEHLCEVHESASDWIKFDQFLFWFTERDDPSIASPLARVRHYGVWRTDAPPLIHAFRASAMNVRVYNHNLPEGRKHPRDFVTRHYQVRSAAHLARRNRDREGLAHKLDNYHFDYMRRNADQLVVPAERLHYDDGKAELDRRELFDWRPVIGIAELKRLHPDKWENVARAWRAAGVLD